MGPSIREDKGGEGDYYGSEILRLRCAAFRMKCGGRWLRAE